MEQSVTDILLNLDDQESRANFEALLPLVYPELKKLASSYMRRERPGTLQTTALVHEAYLKLVDQNRVKWQNRAHFYGVAAQLMRRILIDYARQRSAVKRGGAQVRVDFEEGRHGTPNKSPELLDLEQALQELETIDPRQARVVECRYFAGMNIEETAEALGTSPATVKRDWAMAKAWLARALSKIDIPASEGANPTNEPSAP